MQTVSAFPQQNAQKDAAVTPTVGSGSICRIEVVSITKTTWQKSHFVISMLENTLEAENTTVRITEDLRLILLFIYVFRQYLLAFYAVNNGALRK
jgi:hypothetical protein